jgi:hypothetical protein
MTFFIMAQAPEPYIVITGFEVAVVLFFIILYIVRLDRLMKWLFWPLLVSIRFHQNLTVFSYCSETF